MSVYQFCSVFNGTECINDQLIIYSSFLLRYISILSFIQSLLNLQKVIYKIKKYIKNIVSLYI